ncbi:hypothetical protein AHiyo8_34210 [Arthrobacter sp. Hiyo8]|nr:hypothetical protein AHiyo8_34210 [Arthrobacter sp. Hiyo8]
MWSLARCFTLSGMSLKLSEVMKSEKISDALREGFICLCLTW